MSCFIISDESTADLARFLARVFNNPGMIGPGICGGRFQDQFQECRDYYGYYEPQKISRRLRAVNLAAYNHRYSGHSGPEDIPELFPMGASVPDFVVVKDRTVHMKIQPWHYSMKKKIDCFLYQIDEGAPELESFVSDMKEFSRQYSEFIITNTPEYDTAEWG